MIEVAVTGRSAPVSRIKGLFQSKDKPASQSADGRKALIYLESAPQVNQPTPSEKAPIPVLNAEIVPINAGCPFCGESIFATAKKSKHCGEFLDPELRKRDSKIEKFSSTQDRN
ncbi:MAG: hypothetical protein ACOYKN_16095 [Pirellula sp.]